MEDFVVTGVRFALDIAFKATVLLAVIALAVSALSRRSAAVRQLVATLGLAGALLLPVASLVAPQWEIPLVPSPLPAASDASIAPESREAPIASWNEEESLSRASAEGPRVRSDRSRPSGETSVREEAPAGAATALRENASPSSKPLIDPVASMFGILLLWSVGTVFALARLVVGMARVAGIRRRASSEADGSWTELLSSLSEKIRLERPVRLFFSDEIAV